MTFSYETEHPSLILPNFLRSPNFQRPLVFLKQNTITHS